jgi:hypothetical protein
MSQANAVIEFDSLNNPPEGFYASAMGWYFHGELQDMVGFDIPSASVDLIEVADGIYAGTYKGLDCTFFNWSYIEEDTYSKKRRHRGFIVLNSDKTAYDFAQLAYDTKRKYL